MHEAIQSRDERWLEGREGRWEAHRSEAALSAGEIQIDAAHHNGQSTLVFDFCASSEDGIGSSTTATLEPTRKTRVSIVPSEGSSVQPKTNPKTLFDSTTSVHQQCEQCARAGAISAWQIYGSAMLIIDGEQTLRVDRRAIGSVSDFHCDDRSWTAFVPLLR